MKTIKQLREEYDNLVLDQVQIAPDKLMLEGRERSAIKPMAKTVPSTAEMPTMLMFRRMAYKIYPNKQVVALYYSKYVNKYLSIPFGPDGNLNLSESIIHDEIELDEGVVRDVFTHATAGHLLGATAGLPGAVVGTLAGAGYGAYKSYKKSKEKKNMKEDWSDTKYKSPSGGLTQAGVDAYNRKTGGNLKTAVTTPPSRLKKGSRAANRRKSFCARMGGMKKRLTSAKTARDPDSRINKALRKWNCEESFKQKLAEKRQLREQQQIDEFWGVAGRLALGTGAGEAITTGAKEAIKRAPAVARYAKDAASKFFSKFRKTKGKGETPRDPSAMNKSNKTPKPKPGADLPISPNVPSAPNQPPVSAADGEPAIVRRKPDAPRSSSVRAKSSREFAPHGSLTPTQQSRYTANILARENKISDIQNMINEGGDTMDLSINGRTITLNNSMAKRILEVYDSVNNKNKKIVESMLNEDLDSFKKLLNFSIKA